MTNKFQISNFKYLIMILMLALMAAIGCARKDSIAQAAETSPAPSPSAPAAPGDASEDSEQVKHKVMAFDLEGLADDGSKKWDVKGKSAESITENQVKLNDVVANSYGKEAQATITADAGLYDKSKNNVRLEQNVKAVIENTQKNTGEFMGLPPVNGSAVYGSAAGPQKMVIPAPAGANKPKKTKTVITCDGEVEFNYEKNEGYFNKNVHVVNDEGTIDADKITVYLDSGTKSVKIIVAEGNVKIQRGDNITYSDKATYLAADKKIVLTGKPRIVMYQEGDLQANFLGTDKK